MMVKMSRSRVLEETGQPDAKLGVASHEQGAQRREEGFWVELRGLRASILQVPRAAEGAQRPELTTTTMTAERPRMAPPTPHWHTAGASVTPPANPSQQTAATPGPAESSYMAPPAERVIRKEAKMPMFQQGEDIENYLLRFERIARTWA
ncbi:hypothetical protein SKAU_G00095490 [Synaphobranchus kaupii]|uniref:Uncharacterized protein n=1 Tax=Synaphobranchus kaupii TaxID=118154 RepID=A0A9Q1FXK2_SYNKA|nr:hypothetical protein SKAU_G00095490 [Synaphobranchus kaupii]